MMTSSPWITAPIGVITPASGSDVTSEVTRAEAAEGTLIPLSQKGAANGVMALDASGVGASAPKAHAQGLHGRGGTDTLLNGVEFSNTTANQANNVTILGPRTGGLVFPVPTFQPKAGALVLALDIAPSAGAAASTNNGLAWVDVCDAPVIDANPYAGTSLRIGNGTTITVGSIVCADVSTRKFGGAAGKPLAISAAWDGASNPQILLSDMTSGTPYIRVGYDGSDVITGKASALATTATLGFLFITGGAGVPTGVPTHAGAGNYPLYFNSSGVAGSRLYIYNGGWVALA